MENKLRYMKPLTMVGLVAASGAVWAGTQGTVSFNTAAEATVVPVKHLDFGEEMGVRVGTQCTITPGFAIAAALSGVNNSTDPQNKLIEGTVPTFGGEECGGPAAADNAGYRDNNIQQGIFEITGVHGQLVSVSFSDSENTFLKFTPDIAYYPGSTTLFTEVDPVASTDKDDDVSSGEVLRLGTLRSTVQGQNHPLAVGTLAVGGILEAVTKLDAETPYSLEYTINVNYE